MILEEDKPLDLALRAGRDATMHASPNTLMNNANRPTPLGIHSPHHSSAQTNGRISGYQDPNIAFDQYEASFRTGNPSGIIPDKSKKTHCTFFLRNRECNFAQEGCKYSHEMPQDWKTLERIGMKSWPDWYIQLNPDRLYPYEAGGEKVLKAHIGGHVTNITSVRQVPMITGAQNPMVWAPQANAYGHYRPLRGIRSRALEKCSAACSSSKHSDPFFDGFSMGRHTSSESG